MLLRIVCIFFVLAACADAERIDDIDFGNKSSEDDHGFKSESCESYEGALKTSARRLLPRKSNWLGGRLEFRMKVDPDKLNYFTAKFWGGDLTGEASRLMLFVDGKQVGQRHLGEVDPLDILDDKVGRAPDRFFYKTLPLPEHLTKGKSQVTLAISVEGAIWGYGDTLERWQRDVQKPSRGLYRGYTHNSSFLEIDRGEKSAKPPRKYPTRPGPGPEVLDEVVKAVNGHLDSIINRSQEDKIDMNQVLILARACYIPWTRAYQKKDALNKVVRSIDAEYIRFADDSKFIEKEWHGVGPLGEAISLLEKPLKRYLNHKIEGTDVLRRDAWKEMLVHSRDHHIANRRSYTNQAMTVDINIYRSNRGIAVLAPKEAWPEKRAIRILHEAIGLVPWSGSHKERFGRPEWPLGRRFMQTTDEGLTRELGYVGAYGEITVPITRDIYAASKPSFNAEGDPRIKEHLVKMSKARSVFRFPGVDQDGCRAMRMETVIGWRDWHYPGDVTYGQYVCDDGGPFDTAAETMDPELVGYSHQMLEDNQYFVAVQKMIKGRGGNRFKALLRVPGNFKKISEAKVKRLKNRLPTTDGQPDFVFADPGVGAIAFKHGDNVCFASLYWRSRYGINNLARVHFISPNEDRDATVQIKTGFKDSGHIFKVQNRTNAPFKDIFEDHYKDSGMDFGMSGQPYPIAVVPSFMKDYRPGKENLFAGKGDYYLMIYGRYCVAMNCTSKTVRFDVPEEFLGAKSVADPAIKATEKFRLKRGETAVFYRSLK